MFTGLIQRTATLHRLLHNSSSARLLLSLPSPFLTPLLPGESIAVNGACLTLAALHHNLLTFDLLEETLRVTALSQKSPGALLNLERALRANDPLGGHLLSGHVDTVARVLNLYPSGPNHILQISLPTQQAQQVLPKGSIAIDGVSLTVVETTPASCSVHLIPTTWQHTALHTLRPGDPVNIETDLITKQIRAAIPSHSPHPPDRLRQLKNAGF